MPERVDAESMRLKHLEHELESTPPEQDRPAAPKAVHTESEAVRVPLPALRRTLNKYLSVELDTVNISALSSVFVVMHMSDAGLDCRPSSASLQWKLKVKRLTQSSRPRSRSI